MPTHRYCGRRDLARIEKTEHPNAYLCVVCWATWTLDWSKSGKLLLRMTHRPNGGLAVIVGGSLALPDMKEKSHAEGI